MKNNKVKERKLEMVVTGNEKSQEEIVWNNLLDYMKGKQLDTEAQKTYMKNTILYLQYEKKKNKLLTLIAGTPTLLGLLGTTGAYFAGNHTLATSLAVTTGVIALIGAGIKLVTDNPYNKQIVEFSDVKQREDVYRKVAPIIKK